MIYLLWFGVPLLAYWLGLVVATRQLGPRAYRRGYEAGRQDAIRYLTV